MKPDSGKPMREETRSSASVRRAMLDDAPEIASVLQRSFAEYESFYTAEAFAATISTPDLIRERINEGPVWIAVRQGKIVGTVSALPRAEALYVRGMAVDPAARARGTGRLLLERVEEFAIRKGFERLFLSTTPFLSSAIRLYEKYGFSRTNEGPHELSGTPLFTMVKHLK
jgi:GNAT superfamily N-acetyltransferase